MTLTALCSCLINIRSEVNNAQQITALDAAMTLLFHTGGQGRGASKFNRWAVACINNAYADWSNVL